MICLKVKSRKLNIINIIYKSSSSLENIERNISRNTCLEKQHHSFKNKSKKYKEKELYDLVINYTKSNNNFNEDNIQSVANRNQSQQTFGSVLCSTQNLDFHFNSKIKKNPSMTQFHKNRSLKNSFKNNPYKCDNNNIDSNSNNIDNEYIFKIDSYSTNSKKFFMDQIHLLYPLSIKKMINLNISRRLI